jgi:AraC family ethanolamine operon transcriptional activator
LFLSPCTKAIANCVFGIGPKAHLQCHLLSAVRDQLLTRSGHSLTADIANSWGFWHMGQFAADYRKLFGELPYKSLKQIT